MIIYYSICVLADDAISNLAKRPCIRIKSEDRHAAYCFKPGPSLYPENTLTKHRRHYKTMDDLKHASSFHVVMKPS